MDSLVASFPAGVTTSGDLGCVNITILEDMVLEGQHSFVVHIAEVTPDEVNVISPSIINVFIGDNDGEFNHNPVYQIDDWGSKSSSTQVYSDVCMHTSLEICTFAGCHNLRRWVLGIEHSCCCSPMFTFSKDHKLGKCMIGIGSEHE